MKKLIYIFTIFISLFIFYNSFKQFTVIEVERIENAFDGIENEEVITVEMNEGNNRIQFYDDLISFIKKNGETTYTSISYQDEDMVDYNSMYLYSRNSRDLFKNNKIYLKNNRIIDFSKPTSDYYSSDLDDPCYDHIVFLERNSNKLYNKVYKFHQFEEIKRVDNVDYYFVYFITSNTDELKEKIDNSNISQYVNGYPIIDRIEYRNIDTSFFNKLLLICVITILLLTICDILKRKKEIIICKLNGMGNLYIVFKVYYKKFLISSCLYFITFIICYCMWVGRIHEVVYEFIQIQLRYFVLFVLLNIVVWFLIYFMIYFMKNNNELKKTAYLKVISITDILLKIIVLILLINPLIEYVRLGISETRNLYYILSNKEILRNQIYVGSIMDDNEHSISSLGNWIQDYMHKKGAIYQDFSINMEFDNFDEYENPYELPYIMVNTNYMKDYKVVNAKTNAVLDFTKIKKEVLLIPEKYKNDGIDTSIYSDNKDCDIVYVKNGQMYLNHDPLTAPIYGWYMKDPIVFVEDRIRNWGYPSLLLPYENMDEIKKLKKDLESEGIVDNYTLKNINIQYDFVIEKAKDRCLEILFVMVMYVIVIFVFLYQSIFIYFIENKEKCALKYIHGYSFMERHGEMLLMNISIYIIPLLVGWFYYHIPLVELLLVIGIAILFEIFSMWIITRIFEKNKIIEILKGE